VEMFKVRSRYYWTKRIQQRIVISREKHKILKVLATPKRRPEIARAVKMSHRSVSKRLTELIRLGLVEKVNSNWRRIEVAKRVIVK
jgi:predicted transcriptional regulator